MPGFYFYTSNDQLGLVRDLGEMLRENRLTDVFELELIVIQSLGMKRWISLHLAEQLGILAHTRFLFPNQLLNDVFEKVVPEFQKEALFDREAVSWKIMDILPGLLDNVLFKDLSNYLHEEGKFSQIKSYQLALKIASLFDQYCMYRPQMIMEWDAGKKNGWQADLWRALRTNGIESHLPALRMRFFKQIAEHAPRNGTLPERITVFGITTLPPFHIEVLAALSHYTDIHLFFMNPSPKYWGDIMSKKEIAWGIKRQKDPLLTEEALHLEQGNPLLASFGKSGRSFFQLLLSSDFNTQMEHEDFQEPDSETLLASIQADIFNLVDRELENHGQWVADPDDRSLQIHSCHSRMRETEVLHGQLQLMMSQNPELKPGDILVMAPDINLYASLVKAVFSPPMDSTYRLPFSIADRNHTQESKVIQWFLMLLSLPGSRFKISEILDLLESEAILARYDLKTEDSFLLRDWLISVNIRWGLDSAHRQSAGTPPTYQNTWDFGLERILLGLAMPDDDGLLYEGILPFDRIEGGQAVLLGKFLSFFSDLRALVQPATGDQKAGKRDQDGLLIDTSRTLNEWVSYLHRLIRVFFEEKEAWEEELQIIRKAINQLEEVKSKTGFSQKVDFEIMRNYLSQYMEQGSTGFGFLGAGITFCSMLPMRSIPFKVVALLGLNEQVFPRQSQPLSFDLMAKHPLPGDRSLKEDDRYLFLEAIISARETLYISYIGQSLKDNSTIPPSTLVSELIQYLESIESQEDTSVVDQVIKKHHLQAFNPRYFGSDTKPLSFSLDNLSAAKTLLKRSAQTPGAFIKSLPEPDSQWNSVDIDQLISFFDNPSKFLLKQRLGLSLDDESETISETEPFQLDGLDRYTLNQKLVASQLQNHTASEVRDFFQANGILPPENVGRVLYNQQQDSATQFLAAVRSYLREETAPPVTVDCEIGGFRLSGKVEDFGPSGLIQYRFARLRAKDRIGSWLRWLVLNLLVPESQNRQAILVGLNHKKVIQTLSADPVQMPESFLVQLLKLYREGLTRPLPFFPGASEAYILGLTGKAPEKALQLAETSWQGSEHFREKDDPYFNRCFGHTHPLDNEFIEISKTVLLPIFSHYSEKK
ncbi:MAG: exodeoxyribonuclease V subunit gamma [Deltaproteobacteria bacterium]|nr:exodeoxyribonuclease V subunit gamma [Deltaproteobacteria bacterium]